MKFVSVDLWLGGRGWLRFILFFCFFVVSFPATAAVALWQQQNFA